VYLGDKSKELQNSKITKNNECTCYKSFSNYNFWTNFQSVVIIPHLCLQSEWFNVYLGRTKLFLCTNLAFVACFYEVGTNLVPLFIEQRKDLTGVATDISVLINIITAG